MQFDENILHLQYFTCTNLLINFINPKVVKRETIMRPAITVKIRLIVILGFFVTGESCIIVRIMKTLIYQ